MSPSAARWATLAVVLVVSCFWQLSVPASADPGWFDAGRHALDGAFMLDSIRSGAIVHPMQAAIDYYSRYPAIAPAIYPPGFSLLEAVFFAIFGVHAWVARLTVTFCIAVGALGSARLASDMRGPTAAPLAALLYFVPPLLVRWGRDVMLEPMAAAAVVWSLVYARRFLVDASTRSLLFSLAIACVAPYAKQNFGIVFVMLGVLPLAAGQPRRLAEGRVWLGVLGCLVVGVPLAYVTFRWGMFNLEQAFSQLETRTLTLWEHVSFHIVWLPDVLGWPLLALAVAGLAVLWRHRGEPEGRLNLAVALVWLGVSYLTLTSLVKEPRHQLVWTPLAATLGGIAFAELGRLNRSALAAAAVAGAAMFGWSLSQGRPLWCERLDEPVRWLEANPEDGSAILTSIEGVGSLVFRVRSEDTERRMRVYRSDKVFESRMINPHWDVVSRVENAEAIKRAFSLYGIRFMVLQPELRGFTEVEQMLLELAASDDFEPVAQFDVACPIHPAHEQFQQVEYALSIYRFRGELAEAVQIPSLALPIADIETRAVLNPDD